MINIVIMFLEVNDSASR